MPSEPSQTEATIPVSALADRRLAVVSLAARTGAVASISDEEVSQRTGGRPQAKGVARCLERLEACGYIRVEGTGEGRRIGLGWRDGRC